MEGDGKTAPLKARNAGSSTALVSSKAVALPADLGPEGRPHLGVFEKFWGRFQTSALPPASPAQGSADRGWTPARVPGLPGFHSSGLRLTGADSTPRRLVRVRKKAVKARREREAPGAPAARPSETTFKREESRRRIVLERPLLRLMPFLCIVMCL